MKPNSLTVIVGPSGSGKTTLAELFVSRLGYAKVVSTTTRAARPGEEQGIHYNFVERSLFKEMILNDEFVEYAEFGGNFYGITHMAIDTAVKQGNGYAVSVNEIQGYLNLQAFNRAYYGPSVTGIFLSVSHSTIEKRLRDRNMSSEDLTKRLALAYHESLNIRHFHRAGSDARILCEPTYRQLDRFLESYCPYVKTPHDLDMP